MIFITKAWHSRGQRFDPAYLHQKPWKPMVFKAFSCFLLTFKPTFRPLEFRSNLKHSRGAVMARISMRNVQKSPVSEYFDLFLSSAAAIGEKDKTLSTYKHHFHSISKRLDVTLPLNRLNKEPQCFSDILHFFCETEKIKRILEISWQNTYIYIIVCTN